MLEEQMTEGLNLNEGQRQTDGKATFGEMSAEQADEAPNVHSDRTDGLDDAYFEENRVQSVKEEELVEGKVTEPIRSIEFLLDIPLELSVEIGRTKLEIRELLKLGPGSVVELDKLAGEPLDVYVNDRLVARGEVVVVNEKFGLRLTEVVSKKERLENLK